MSIMLGNDSVVHHPMNNHKKLINDSGGDVHFDSGYASVASISSNQTDASASTSMKKSLVPIAENYELQFDDASGSSIIETPTTRNTRQLSAFHIQTPPNDKRMMETTPTKANNYWALRSSQKSSTKENRNSAMSPYKVTPNKRKSSDSNYLSFTDEKMKSGDKFEQFSLYDLPKENAEDSFEMSTNEPSISPITNHNKSSTSTATTILGINRRTLQRHPSGIESSTPISRSFKRTHTQTIVKAHFDGDNAENARALKRKFKSFSPAKRNNVLKEISINTPVLLERHDEEDVSDAARAHNPARKVLQFSTNQFDNLLSGHASVAWMPSQAVPRVESTITPTKSTMTTRTATLQRQQHIALSPSPTRSELPNQCIQEEAMRRPMKNLKRSTVAVAPTTPNGKRLEKELHKTSIHRTSPRSPLRNPLKRSATTAQGDESVTGEATAEPPAKRKLFYDGLEKLDILTHLKGANNVTDLILSKLSDKDLYASYHVSQSWSQIITNNTPAYSRQSRYARLSQHQKENVNGRNLRTVSEPSTVQTSKRIPFAARNAHYSLRSSPRRSPPVSPSKRKFHENQKVDATFTLIIFNHSQSFRHLDLFQSGGERIGERPKINSMSTLRWKQYCSPGIGTITKVSVSAKTESEFIV